jgi:hypothetical protein
MVHEWPERRGRGKGGGGRRSLCRSAAIKLCVGRGAGLTEGIWYEQPEAWNFGHAILQSESASIESKLFAASTLKGKVFFFDRPV